MSNKPKVAKAKKKGNKWYYRDVLGIPWKDAKIEQFVKWAVFQHESHGFSLDSDWFFDDVDGYDVVFEKVVDSLDSMIEMFVVDGNSTEAINHLHRVNNRMPDSAKLSLQELREAYKMIRRFFEGIIEVKEGDVVIKQEDFGIAYGDNQYPNGKKYMIRFTFNPALFGFASASSFGGIKQTRIF